MPKVVLLGSGNVAFHLTDALISAGHKIEQIYGRNEKTTKELAKTANTSFCINPKDITPLADIYFFCMNDIANIEISGKINVKSNPIIVHTAGSQSMSIFKDKTKNYGVFYPFQTFTKGVKTDFSKVPVCIEASNDNTYQSLEKIADSLNCKSYNLDEKGRETLHLCGVFAANFMNHCVSLSEALLEENQISKDLIKPLLEQSFYKIINSGSQVSQTGPALREDQETINKHLNILKDNKQYSKVYQVLTESIIEWKKKN